MTDSTGIKSNIKDNIKEYIWGTENWIYQDDDVLIKIIEANTPLSVQVHPDDEYAALHENGSKGKNEMWYVLDTFMGTGLNGEPLSAYVYAGVKKDCTRDEIRKAAADGTLENLLVKYEVRAGDVINIPAGTIHAIGGGCRILEVQQNSTITYRLYDYNRKGTDGKPRQLHLDKALDAAGLSPSENLTRLPLETEYFSVYENDREITAEWTSSEIKKSFVFSKY